MYAVCRYNSVLGDKSCPDIQTELVSESFDDILSQFVRMAFTVDDFSLRNPEIDVLIEPQDLSGIAVKKIFLTREQIALMASLCSSITVSFANV